MFPTPVLPLVTGVAFVGVATRVDVGVVVLVLMVKVGVVVVVVYTATVDVLSISINSKPLPLSPLSPLVSMLAPQLQRQAWFRTPRATTNAKRKGGMPNHLMYVRALKSSKK